MIESKLGRMGRSGLFRSYDRSDGTGGRPPESEIAVSGSRRIDFGRRLSLWNRGNSGAGRALAAVRTRFMPAE
jgi:hypothetical protein